MADQQIEWISTYGGRFVVMPDSALSHWHGLPDDGRDPLDPSHDYGRANSTSGFTDLLSVGDAPVLVFGENELGGVWLNSAYPILFEWMYAESKGAVIEALSQLPSNLPTNESTKFRVTEDHLNVFDSASPGESFDRDQSCRFPIVPGNYTIFSAIYEPCEETGLIIHRFEPV